PVRFKSRFGATWDGGPWEVAGHINYTQGYTNNAVVPSVPISSWVTLDLHTAYTFDDADGAFAGSSIQFDVNNLFDQDPPFVASPNSSYGIFGYDPTNASPIGRVISIGLRKTW